MDSRLEMAEALMDLSRASERVAKLLAKGAIPEVKNDATVAQMGTSKEVIDFKLYQQWPDVKHQHRPYPPLDLEGLRVLELSYGPTQPIAWHYPRAKRIDLITDSFKLDPQPDNLKIIKATERTEDYDIGIIWESIEFCGNPALTLKMFKKCCQKVYARFRPWSGQDGAFLGGKAFVHLVAPVDSRVESKVIRPLATYEALLKDVGFTVLERHINTTQIDPFFSSNDQIMNVLRDRTWGQNSSFDDVLKVMATDSVDYVLA